MTDQPAAGGDNGDDDLLEHLARGGANPFTPLRDHLAQRQALALEREASTSPETASESEARETRRFREEVEALVRTSCGGDEVRRRYRWRQLAAWAAEERERAQ